MGAVRGPVRVSDGRTPEPVALPSGHIDFPRTAYRLQRSCSMRSRRGKTFVMTQGGADALFVVLEGEIPSALDPPSGCRFHTRCPYVIDRCRAEIPQLLPNATGHLTACHRSDELPPADAIVPSDGGLSPALTRLIAAFNRMEGAGSSGVGTDDATV